MRRVGSCRVSKSSIREHWRQVRIQTQTVALLVIGLVGTQSVIVHIFDQAQTLGNLPGGEFIFMAVPEPAATGIMAVMADAIAFKSDMLVPHDCFERLQAER